MTEQINWTPSLSHRSPEPGVGVAGRFCRGSTDMLIRREDEDTQKIGRGETGRDWSDAVTSQGMLGVPRS